MSKETEKILEQNSPPECPRVEEKVDSNDRNFGEARILTTMKNTFAFQCTGVVIEKDTNKRLPRYSGRGFVNGTLITICVDCKLRTADTYAGETGISIFAAEENKPL